MIGLVRTQTLYKPIVTMFLSIRGLRLKAKRENVAYKAYKVRKVNKEYRAQKVLTVERLILISHMQILRVVEVFLKIQLIKSILACM